METQPASPHYEKDLLEDSGLNADLKALSSQESPNQPENDYYDFYEAWRDAEVESLTGADPAEFSSEAKDGLFKIEFHTSIKRAVRLHKVVDGISDPKTKAQFFENFSAMGFGDDFGDALLDIATDFKGEQLDAILDGITTARKSISKITELFSDFDGGNFAASFKRASNERLTDILTTFQVIGKDGVATAKIWDEDAPATINYNQATEALKYEADALSMISGAMGDVKAGKKGAFAETIIYPTERRESTFYSLYSPDHGYVLLYTRPEGSSVFEPSFEYGKTSSRYNENSSNTGVEARISFIANPVSPFELPSPFKPKAGEMSQDKISAIRLDREGRAPDESVSSKDREPIKEIGTVSVDLASIAEDENLPGGKVARLIAIGNVIRSLRDSDGQNAALNHNTNFFKQDKYGTSAGFRTIVEHLDSLMSRLCKSHAPKPNEGFRGLRNRALSRIAKDKALAADKPTEAKKTA